MEGWGQGAIGPRIFFILMDRRRDEGGRTGGKEGGRRKIKDKPYNFKEAKTEWLIFSVY